MTTPSLDAESTRDAKSPTPAYSMEPVDAQEALRALYATIDLLPVGIAHLDREGRILFVNGRMCTILDYPRDELLERGLQEFSFPEDISIGGALIGSLAASLSSSYRQEKRFIRRDGSTLWARVTVSGVGLRSREADFFLVIVEDISEQRSSESARRAAEERLRVALDASRTGTFRWDSRTRELEWDVNFERLFGLAPAAARSDADFVACIHRDDLQRMVEAWWLCATEGVELDEEFRVVWPDGSVHWLRHRGRAAIDADGAPLYVAGAATDVTERKTAEVERERLLALERAARAEAERAIKLRDEVLGVVAHDLRNPVHTISLGAELMLDLPLSEEQRLHQLRVIERTTKEMTRLISDLLDVTRIESGMFTLQPEPVRVIPLIEEMLELFAPQAQERGLTLLAEIAQDVPPVRGDHQRLVQVMSNLLGNSLKFTEAGGRITINVAHPADQPVARISVQDTGCGIPPENLAHVFDRFWQANRASRAGAGLGLAIARGIIGAHGGEIWVESTVGVGTTFHFTLPLADE